MSLVMKIRVLVVNIKFKSEVANFLFFFGCVCVKFHIMFCHY